MKKTQTLSNDTLKYLIARLIENADEAVQEYRDDKQSDFKNGRSLAYYEMLDTLKSELTARGQSLDEFGLNVNLEKKYL